MKFNEIDKLISTGYDGRLWHVSFREFREEVWSPQELEDQVNLSGEDINYPHICVTPTPLQCIRSMWKDIEHMFEKIPTTVKRPTVTAHMYEIKHDTETKVITSDKLLNNEIVKDAHITKEVWILSPVRVFFQSHIEIQINRKSDLLKYHPYNDQSLEKEDLGPSELIVRGRRS